MKLRIAMVGACPYPVAQGSQVYLRDTALALKERGHDVRLVVYANGVGEAGDALPIRRAAAIPGASKTKAGPSFAKPLQDFALLVKLRNVIRNEKIDLVCAHNYEALLVALLAGKRPILYFAHNAMSDELPHYFNGSKWAKKFGRFLDGALPKRADCTVAPHQRLAGYLLLRACEKAKMHIIPPPVEVSLFLESEYAASVPPVLYAGNLDAYQNLGLLAGAMEIVRQTVPDARLIVATADSECVEGAEMIPTPDFNSLKEALAQDAVFAVPRVSWSGYPIKLLNAMAAGKAVVACESAAYPLTHEVNGLIVPDNDAEAFAQAMLRLLRDHALRKRLGIAARQYALAAHSPAKIGEALDDIVYKKVSEPRQR